jgi:hypothetical protein
MKMQQDIPEKIRNAPKRQWLPPVMGQIKEAHSCPKTIRTVSKAKAQGAGHKAQGSRKKNIL